jgi:adenine deaminase
MDNNARIPLNSRRLVDCAMGRTPADMVIRNGNWVCVQTGEFVPETDVAIIDGRIAYVGKGAGHTVGPDTQVVDAGGRFLVPGLLDAHMHVESGMLTVTEFVRAVAPHGTTGMFVDPHEIANILGMKGVKLMVDEAQLQPIHVFVQMPSCVPSSPGMETSGASLGAEEVAEAMTWPGIIGLGEMMNFPGVYSSNEKIHAELDATRKANKIIGGHYASPDLGLPFHGYVAGGPQDDHEGTRLVDAVERARQGMRVMLRYGSAWHDVATQVRAVTEMGMDSRHFLLCTDDSHSATLINEGHIDRVLKHAISQGLAPMTAIQMATINTAEYFGVGRDMGSIAPGRWGDIVIASNLVNFQAEVVIAKGHVIAESGQMCVEKPAYAYPAWAVDSVHIAHPLSAADFKLAATDHKPAVANVIGIIENQAPTRHLRMQVPVIGGEVRADPRQDLAKLAVIERHSGEGRIQVGLVQGFGFNPACAVATTVAHDCHQMIVVGTDDANMAVAANELVRCGGGQVVVRNGAVIGRVALRIAGIISDEPAVVVAQQAGSVLEGFRTCGCQLNNPNMQLSLLALVVIPDLRMSDLGLVDVNQFKFIPVIEQA